MEIVSFFPFGRSEAMVHSCRRRCEWKLDWTSGQILFCILSAFTNMRLTNRNFNFRQNDKESIGVAWARFTLLVKSGPDLSLPEHLLLQHMLILTRSLHTISILPLEDLSLILPQPKVGESSTKSWTEPLLFVSTSQFPQSLRCIKRSLQKSNRNPLKANQ